MATAGDLLSLAAVFCWAGYTLGLRTRPDHWGDLGGMDGFFVARLRAPA